MSRKVLIALAAGLLLLAGGVAHASTNQAAAQPSSQTGFRLLVEPVEQVSVSALTSGQSGSTVVPEAVCPQGTVAVGGGYTLSDHVNIAVRLSAPTANGWTVSGTALTAVIHEVTAHAVCATVVP